MKSPPIKEPSIEEVNLFRAQLVDDKPAIDSALKSFASWRLAQAIDEDSLSQSQIMTLTRLLSQTINRHIVPIQRFSDWKADLVAQLWNEIVASNLKPTKTLGRKSLQLVYKEMDFQLIYDHEGSEEWSHISKSFLSAFEGLLYGDNADSRLMWDADGGQAELSRRATDRQQRAVLAVKEADDLANQKTPFIEERTEE